MCDTRCLVAVFPPFAHFKFFMEQMRYRYKKLMERVFGGHKALVGGQWSKVFSACSVDPMSQLLFMIVGPLRFLVLLSLCLDNVD